MDQKDMLMRNEVQNSLEDWHEKEKMTLELLNIAGELRFNKGIELILFRKRIYDSRPSELINHHQVSIKFGGIDIMVEHSLQIAQAIADLPTLPASKIDIGKLNMEWASREDSSMPLSTFVSKQLETLTGKESRNTESKDVVLYGFGRIGRLLTRRIIEETGRGEQLRLRAIVLRAKLKDQHLEVAKRASLLRDDSVHGAFHGTVNPSEDANYLIINGNRVRMIFANSPSDIDYTEYGIQNALLIDNTGVWRDKEALSIHLRPGISQVMLTAPGKGIPNIVHGVNQDELFNVDSPIFCAASCTTNAIVPIIKVMDDHYGIEKGHIETIHAYTSDQNLLDNFHKKPRRGRGAATNMVLTNTGAAQAVSKVLPHLAGKLTGNAVRVPTPDVSLAIMVLSLKNPTKVEELNNHLLQAAISGPLVEQIHYSTSEEYVSSNAVGMISTSVLDAPSTNVSIDGKTATIYAWYDNEYGYACQVVRLAKHAAKVRRYVYY